MRLAIHIIVEVEILEMKLTYGGSGRKNTDCFLALNSLEDVKKAEAKDGTELLGKEISGS